MNLQQLEYIVAVDQYRHFADAAKSCFVTQPTLSMMIHKLEEELNIQIFNRTKQPVSPSPEGEKIIDQAKLVLAHLHSLKDMAKEMTEGLSGDIHLGIIPTLAPYILPLFIHSFSQKYPQVKIYIQELVTDEIIHRLKKGDLTLGILATPLGDSHLTEHPLFYEEFFVYASSSEKLPKKKYLLPKDVNLNKLWLLEEGHCMRNQIFNLCELKKKENKNDNLYYEAGSIETLINLVDKHEGMTIVPHLAVLNLKSQQKKNIREFAAPKPVREISIVTGIHFSRKKLLALLKTEINQNIPFKNFHRNKICRRPDPANCQACTLNCLQQFQITDLKT